MEDLPVRSITHQEPVPLRQRPGFHFCGFHVLARVFLFVTDQHKVQLSPIDIMKVRDFCAYLVLSKTVG